MAHIYLKRGEGGLNLNMTEETLGKISNKGLSAADMFLGKDGNPAFDFDEHRWVRLLLLMDHLERELSAARDLPGIVSGSAASMTAGVKALFDAQVKARAEPDESKHWYRARQQDWCDEALRRMTALFQMIEAWDNASPRRAESTNDADEVAKFEAASALVQQPPRRPRFFQDHAPKPAGALRVTTEI